MEISLFAKRVFFFSSAAISRSSDQFNVGYKRIVCKDKFKSGKEYSPEKNYPS